ncbi:MAG TPA: aldo/keto reductase, partial [Spirillospora sp.]|nr:aldo/keto reductase [Spirillospora sp.]
IHGWTESWSDYNTDHTWGVIDALRAVAEEASKTPAQVALNWVLNRPGVTAPIIGARSMSQFEDNLGAIGWSLTPEQVAKLDKASSKRLPYPYNYLSNL